MGKLYISFSKKNIWGVVDSLFAIPLWIMYYLLAIYFANFANIDLEPNVYHFLIIPLFITFLSGLAVIINLPEALKVRRRVITYASTFMHGAWSIYVILMLPDEINGYLLLISWSIGIWYLVPLSSFLLSIGLLSLLFLIIVGFYWGLNVTLGIDDYVCLTFCVIVGLSAAVINRIFVRKVFRLKTERKFAEERKKHSETVSKEKTLFFQNISHELRTPLTLILNPLDSLVEKYKDESLALVSKNAKRLYRLVNQLLDFQKISSKKKEIELVPIDLASFLKTCAEYFKVSCESKKIRFSLNIKSERNIFILADVDSLEKIVFNYLSNALKYTKGGYISIELETKDDYVVISVIDSGIGIKKEDRQKLFKIFSQVDGSSSRDFEGTGLGLALVKELAEKMEAEVGVEDGAQGFGSKFWVKFKIASNRDLNVLDVLYVDDDEQVMLFKKYMDRELPFMNFKAVDSSEKAREILTNNNVKCVFYDALMPEEDGVSLLEWVSDEHLNTLRVLLTLKENVTVLEKAINESHIDHVIQKPWQEGEFKEKVIEFVKTSRVKIYPHADLTKFTPKDWLLEKEIEKLSDESVSAENLKDGSGELILVVDDLADMRALISKTLKKHSFRVLTASNGEDALEKIKDNKPELIVTDWLMPKLSGVGLINKIKSDENLAGIPTILLTAKSDDESRGVGIEFGADGFIGKPFSEMELISVVKNNLRLKKREKEIEVLNDNISQNILKRYIPKEKLSELEDGEDIFSEGSKTKNLVILSFDMPEFTTLIEDLGVKNVATILNDYLIMVSEILNSNGGMISKIDRSSITAIFGYSSKVKPSNDINLAISSVEKIRKEICNLNEKHSLEENTIALRYALHAGIVQVGFFGGKQRSDFMAIGKPIERINEIKEKLKFGDIVYTREILSFLDNEKWDKAEKITLEGFLQNEIFFKVGVF